MFNRKKKITRFTFTMEAKPAIIAGLARWDYIFHTFNERGKEIKSPVPTTTLKDAYEKGLFQFDLKTTKTGKEYWKKVKLKKK
jgi:hypothetical protein